MTVILERLSTPNYDTATLLSAIRGGDPTLPRGYAMSLLLATRYPGTRRAIQEVLEDPLEPPELRAIAVRHLGLLPPCTVQDILLRNLLAARDERILLALVRILGRIGDARTLPAIKKVAQCASGLLERTAEFAAILIAYRSGSNELTYALGDRVESVPVPAGCRVGARWMEVGPHEFLACVESLGDEPFGIEYAETGATRIDFDDIRWIVLLDHAIVGTVGFEGLRTSNRFLGIIAEQDPKDESYYPLLLILSTASPDRQTIILHVHDTAGELQYVGQGTTAPDEFRFALRTAARTALTLEASGSIRNGRCTLDRILYTPRLPERVVPARL